MKHPFFNMMLFINEPIKKILELLKLDFSFYFKAAKFLLFLKVGRR